MYYTYVIWHVTFGALEVDILVCFCFCPFRRGYYTEKFLYLCRNSHSECGCKIFVNLKMYLSSDGTVNMKHISVANI
jgi:hypothetical protein